MTLLCRDISAAQPEGLVIIYVFIAYSVMLLLQLQLLEKNGWVPQW